VKPGFWTLSRKMVVLLLLASSVPVGLTAYLTYRQGRERVNASAASYLGGLADAAVQNLDAFNQRYIDILDNILVQPDVLAQCPARTEAATALEARLHTQNLADRAIFGTLLLDPTGTVIVSADPNFLGLNLADRAYVEHAKGVDGISMSLVIARGAKSQAVLVLARRFGPASAPCVAMISVVAANLFKSVRTLNSTMVAGGYIVLVDEHGVRIAHGMREGLLWRPTAALPAIELERMIREHRFGGRTAELLGAPVESRTLFEQARAPRPRRDVWHASSPGNQEDNLIVARRMTSAPWTMFAHAPARIIEAPLASMLRSVAAVGVVMAMLAMLAGLLAARRLIGPVLELTRVSRALAAGDSKARARVDATDEIGELARHLNQAADHAAAEASRLEELVGARTRELTTSNEELNRRRDELIAHRTELLAQTDELSAQRDELARKSTDVERADRMKSEFLANMSHELRTPLNSVIGFADLLQVVAEARLAPVERGYLADIIAAGRHLLLIINDILDLAKIEAGQVRLVIEAVDPEELAAGAISMAMSLARPRGIDLRLTVAARRTGRGDVDRLRQVLLNLLSNAIKFSPAGSAVDLRVDDDDDHLRFSVTDRGPGIAVEAQERLFQPFVQGEAPLVKRHQGTGLGLAICKKLIELHDGTLSVESRPGVGSTFRFTIPAAGRRTVADGPTPSGSTVLVVSSSVGDQAHRARLEQAGYRVATCAAEGDLFAEATQANASLIVIDVSSLGDGPVSDAILREAPRLSQRIPVILLSADSEVLASKPLDSAVLQAICRRLARRDDGPARLLVIDDDPRVAGLVAGTLGSRYRVESAGTAAEVLARARAGEHDLYVIDLMLPDGSGFDVLTALSAEPALRKVPRIVLTAAELDADDRARLRRHAHAVAHKGMVTPDELVDVVGRLALGRAQAVASSAEPKILVVDDNDMNRALVRSILERLSYQVIEARDGIEALVLAERERPALVLMDLAMPGKDGFETTRELRAHPQLGATPIIAVSALAMRSDEDRARAAGVDGFLAKPVDRDALERTVARFLIAPGRSS